jgi:hypothetical protein
VLPDVPGLATEPEVPVVPLVPMEPEVPVVPLVPMEPVVPVVPLVPMDPVVPGPVVVPDAPPVAEVPEVPEVEDELDPSRGSAVVDDEEREVFELRPCAFDRLDFLVLEVLEPDWSLDFPAIAASSLLAELLDVESDGVAFESAVPVASEVVWAVEDACGGVCAEVLPATASAAAPAIAMRVIFIWMLLSLPD